jgi:hypothetical protein
MEVSMKVPEEVLRESCDAVKDLLEDESSRLIDVYGVSPKCAIAHVGLALITIGSAAVSRLLDLAMDDDPGLEAINKFIDKLEAQGIGVED